MSYSVRLTDTAKQDLREIAFWIAGQAKDTAIAGRFVEELRNECKKLVTFPSVGAIPKDRVLKSMGYRFTVHKDYLIFYLISENEKQVDIMAMNDPQYTGLSFEDRFSMLVDSEWTRRKSNRLHSLIHAAGYAAPNACVEDISYAAQRQLDKAQILRLASCTYIEQAHNVVILGATGTGKTYLACALGIAANRNYYSTKYIRLPDLLVEIAMARGDGTYRELMRKYRKYKLLILDEWLLYPLKESEARDLLELIEARSQVASTVFCSQFYIPGWHELLYDPTLADAICDRIVYNSHVLTIKGESMRRMNAISE